MYAMLLTKLSHIHFPRRSEHVTFDSMGEQSDVVHLTGCPSIDILQDGSIATVGHIPTLQGSARIDTSRPYIVVMQHPVTTEYGSGLAQINATIEPWTALVEACR
jgi:UDP-N-acetylglucosamine 2-epimerase